MQELTKQLRRARRRLFLQRLIALIGWCCLAGLCIALVGVGLTRVMPLPVPLGTWLAGGLGLGMLAAAVWAIATRPGRLDAAIELDHRCRLKERVSTALSLSPEQRETPPGQAVVADAIRKVEQVDVAADFPVRPRRSLLWPVLPAVLAVGVAMLLPPAQPPEAQANPDPDVGRRIQREANVLRRELAQQRQEAKRRGLKELDKLLAKVETSAAEVEKAKLGQREALTKLNKLSEQLRDRRAKLAGEEKLRRKLTQLETTKPGPAKPVAEALQQDDLDRASRELDKLAEQLEQDGLTAEQRKQLSEQVQQMREQLQRMAESQRRAIEQLERQYQQCEAAGQDAQAEALQQQLDQLRQSLPSIELSEQLSQRLSQCEKCLKEGDGQGAAEALRGLRGEMGRLADSAAAKKLLEDAERRLSQCRGGICQGQGNGEERRAGQGGLKPGTAPGGFVQDPTDPDGEFFDTQVSPQINPGEMLSVGTADGPNRRGQVAEEVRRQVEQIERGQTDPLEGRRLPRHLRDATREYFDNLRSGE